MKIKVITSYKPGTWEKYADRCVQSILDNWPEINVNVYHEGPCDETGKLHPRLEWIDLHEAQTELKNFKERHKNDPVAHGELQQIPGGVKRLPEAGGMDRGRVPIYGTL